MILYAHGRDGSPWGTKISALRAAGFEVDAPDLRGRTLQDRIRVLDQKSKKARNLFIGSSYGGLAGAWLIQRYPERFGAAILLAPALQLYDDPVTEPSSLWCPETVRMTVIHGVHDQTVPIDVSRAYKARSGNQVQLLEVEDDHRLERSVPRIIQAIRALMPLV